jgi:hypothetical protein
MMTMLIAGDSIFDLVEDVFDMMIVGQDLLVDLLW